jgi:signal transduction histidine kinase
MKDTMDRRAALIDWGVALALLAFGALSVFLANDLDTEGEYAARVPLWAEYALTAAVVLPLAWRRRSPLLILIIVGAAFVVHRVAEVNEITMSSIALFLALFTAGALSRHRARDWVRGGVVAVTMALLGWQLWGEQDYVGLDLFVLSSYSIALNLAFFVTGWLLGDAQRTRRRNEAELARRAGQLAAEREDRARRAVLDERVRIARELHDVVAHHVSVMGVQAAGARRVLGSDPQRAVDALSSVEESGRQAVSELQRLVGFLRQNDTPDDGHPQPTLDDLDQLVASSGLPVRLQWVGRSRPVPSSVALSAYRIVQESLTNVLKHAGPVETTVVVTYTTDGLQVEVRNERGDAVGSGNGSGRGLLGMRERVAMLGGRFEHGLAHGGGYRVFAALPTSDAYDRDGERRTTAGRGSA